MRSCTVRLLEIYRIIKPKSEGNKKENLKKNELGNHGRQITDLTIEHRQKYLRPSALGYVKIYNELEADFVGLGNVYPRNMLQKRVENFACFFLKYF